MMQGFVLRPCSIRAKIQGKQSRISTKDYISNMPDDGLLLILSRLTMKEAARTSVLSRRWTKVWNFIPTLNFDASEALLMLSKTPPCEDEYVGLLGEASGKYIDWVNSVLRSLEGASILDGFKVQFPLDAQYSSDIDNWVTFAFEKKVKCLSMDINVHFWLGLDSYPFPSSISNTDCQFLQKLYLKGVNIDENAVQHFISACPLLEELTIIHSLSEELVHLNIAGPSLCLKRLKIHMCTWLKTIRLSATSLSSFHYIGRIKPGDISYNDVPNLVRVHISDLHIKSLDRNFPLLSSFLLGLETLKLSVWELKNCMANVQFPEMPYLKNLELKLCLNITSESCARSPLVLAYLMKAAPLLRRVKFDTRRGNLEEVKLKKLKNPPKFPLQCLKEIEVVGFGGSDIETAFVKYLLENAIVCEKIVIGCRTSEPARAVLREEYLLEIAAIRKRATKCVKHLKAQYSLGENLVLLNF